MKTSLPYFLYFPKDFYKSTVYEIASTARNGKNIQLIGLKGSGKSLLFRFLLNSDDFKKEFDIHKIDFNLIPERTVKATSEMLVNQIEGKLKKENSKNTLVLVDSFENITDLCDQLLPVFHGLTDTYRDYISFAFSVESPIKSGSVYWGREYYLPPLSKSDFEWFWKGLKADDKYKNKILEISGGLPAIIKRLWEIVVSEGQNGLEKVIENPKINPHLNYQLELMKEGLRGKENYFKVPLYDVFLNGSKNDEFTKLEHKAYVFLEQNKGLIIDRDSLIKAIWGEFASQNVADHALDQLIHRLQKKLEKKNVKIETIRGRGHRLNLK